MVARLLVAVVMLASMSLAEAQVATPPAERVKAVARYVNLATVFVGYVDLRKLDVDVLERCVLEHAQNVIPQEDRPAAQAQIRMAMDKVRQWHKALVDAGVVEVYGIADAQTVKREPGFLVIPHVSKAEEVARALQLALGNGVVVTAANDAVLISSERTAGDLAVYQSAERPELTEAMATSDAPVVLAALLPDELKDAALRRMPQVGGGPIAPLVQSYQWALAELRLPPMEQLQVVVQMKDPAAAAALEKAMRQQWVQEGMDAAAQQLLTPKAQGQSLTLSFGKQQIAGVGAALEQARRRAMQVMSLSNMRQLLVGIMRYAREHKGACPDKLDDLAKYLGPSLQRVLISPVRPNQRPGYIYVKPAAALDKIDPQSLMVYEAFDAWPAGGIGVGYADGHCAQVSDEVAFRKLLKAAEAKP